MKQVVKLGYTFRRWRGRVRRVRRLIYMSPAEARFVELMGGRVFTSKRWRSKRTGFPVSVVWSLGKTLEGEQFRREVRFGRYFVDFANDVGRIIEIDGQDYHMDVVADMDREIYIKGVASEARFLRIPAWRLGQDPDRVQRDVMKFIYS